MLRAPFLPTALGFLHAVLAEEALAGRKHRSDPFLGLRF
jgi:hypothetical protein